MKNSKYFIKMVSFFTIASVLLIFLMGNELLRFFTPISLVLVFTTIIVIFLIYYLIRKNYKDNFKERNVFEFNSFSNLFLGVKMLDVFFQQILVVLLIYIGKTYGGDSYFLLSAILFNLLHLVIFPFNKIRVSMFFLILSIPASIIFISIYLNLGTLSFGIAYMVHLFFYLILGIIDIKGNLTKIIGK